MPNLHVTDAKIVVADEVVETPYAVCKTAVLTVELIGNSKYANHCVRNRSWLDGWDSNPRPSVYQTDYLNRLIYRPIKNKVQAD